MDSTPYTQDPLLEPVLTILSVDCQTANIVHLQKLPKVARHVTEGVSRTIRKNIQKSIYIAKKASSIRSLKDLSIVEGDSIQLPSNQTYFMMLLLQ